jgi:hypothetical protein
MLATKKAAQLPEAEHGGHEQDEEHRDHSECGYGDDDPLHGASVPRQIRD